jgi:hypothetical protein
MLREVLYRSPSSRVSKINLEASVATLQDRGLRSRSPQEAEFAFVRRSEG